MSTFLDPLSLPRTRLSFSVVTLTPALTPLLVQSSDILDCTRPYTNGQPEIWGKAKKFSRLTV